MYNAANIERLGDASVPRNSEGRQMPMSDETKTPFGDYIAERERVRQNWYASYKALTRNAISPAQGFDEPVVLFDDARLRAAEWYDEMWEAVHEGLHPLALGDELKAMDLQSELAEYLTAVLYLRWSVIADIELEPSLLQRIEWVLEHSSFEDPSQRPKKRSRCFHNEGDNMFEPGDVLSFVMGRALSRSVENIPDESNGINGSDTFVRHSSERKGAGANVPMFLASGWNIAHKAVADSLALYFDMMCASGMEATIFPDIWENIEKGKDAVDPEIVSEDIELDELECLFDNEGLSPKTTAMMIFDLEDRSLMSAWTLCTVLDVMDAIPSGVNDIVVVLRTYDARSRTFCAEYAQKHGVSILVDFSTPIRGVSERLPGALDDSVSWNPYALSNDRLFGITYTGLVPPKSEELIHDAAAGSQAGALMAMIERAYEPEDAMVYVSYALPDELRDPEKKARAQEAVEALSFGSISLRGIAEELFSAADYNFILRHLSSDDRIGVGRLAQDIRSMRELYTERGIIPLDRQRAHQGAPIEDGEEDAYMPWTMEEAIYDLAERAHEAGISEYFKAHKKGIPLDSILCGELGRENDGQGAWA